MNAYKVLSLLKENKTELKICIEKTFQKLAPLMTDVYISLLDDANLIDKTIDHFEETHERTLKLFSQWKESNFVAAIVKMDGIMSEDDTGLKNLMQRIFNAEEATKSSEDDKTTPEFLKRIHGDRLRTEIEFLKNRIAEDTKLSVGCRDFWRIRSNFVLNHQYTTQENANRRYQDLINVLEGVLKSEGDKW